MKIAWQSFRDDDLWHHDIEMVYTLNEENLRALFRKYLQPKASSLTETDFQRMIFYDSSLPVTKNMIREAYGMSQQTVINETDQKSW